MTGFTNLVQRDFGNHQLLTQFLVSPLLISESSPVSKHGHQGEGEARTRRDQLGLSPRHSHHYPTVPDAGGKKPIQRGGLFSA